MTPDHAELQIAPASLGVLLDLSRRAREAPDQAVLAFLAVNDSHALAPYRQGAFWLADGGVQALSGVVQIEANAPYAQWLQQVCASLPAGGEPANVGHATLPASLEAEWSDWLPAFGLWLPLPGEQAGGWLFARETPWQAIDIALLAEWMRIWQHAWAARARASWSWRGTGVGARLATSQRPWWRRRGLLLLLGALLLCALPVRLTVLAPGELVPAQPAIIRAPLEGVIGSFAVKPNQAVKAGQILFSFDDAPLQARLEVARQGLAGAEAEYRQAAQQALSDSKSKSQLAMLAAKTEERRAEVGYLGGQLERASVLAPQDGIVLLDDASEWIGRPVTVGERIMRLATPGDVEVEAWLALGDAIPLADAAPVTLYLNASPLDPVAARVRYVAFDAVQRPDGGYAYRVRARLAGASTQRVGLKGTAKLGGQRVPLIYWIVRRPLAAIRQGIGY
ncbi:efflux RND transporter periplasmic adaptor subunit [Massilia sp. TSP1-1-2]|uniref:efflux RND transporter periplasmic adaptor subunit n=1 Tax=Massilia sp. TSP1-1-2 TaxID=2804649 RepID=UPI003CF87AA0